MPRTLTNIFIVAIFFLVSCRNDESDAVMIRIENSSSIDFDSVYVNSGYTENTYYKVQAGMKSEYKAFSSAYRYGLILAYAGDDVFSHQITDFVGERKLENGKYTYQIDVNAEMMSLTLELK